MFDERKQEIDKPRNVRSAETINDYSSAMSLY